MMKISLWSAALLIAAAPLAMAQEAPKAQGSGPATPKVGGSPSGTSTAAPQANGAARSGGSRPTPAAVKEMLEQQGYGQVTDVVEGSEGYTATARKGGREVQLLIDPAGKVSEKE
jgi:hypothetical protein